LARKSGVEESEKIQVATEQKYGKNVDSKRKVPSWSEWHTGKKTLSGGFYHSPKRRGTKKWNETLKG